MVKKIILMCLLCLSLPLTSRADQPSILPDQGQVKILETLNNLPIKEGVTFDFQHSRVLNTMSLGLIGYDGLSLDASWIGLDGVGASLNYNLGALPWKNVIISPFLSYLNIGYTVGYRTLTTSNDGVNPKSDNQFIQGPSVFIKIKL